MADGYARPWPVSIAATDAAVRTQGLTKRFGKVVALDSADLTVPASSIFLLVGPNGAGKTTTTRILLDLARPTSGTVEVLGLDPHAKGAQTRALVGYVPERTDIGYGWMRVDRLLRHHSKFRTTWDAEYARELGDALEIETTKKFGKLSKGNSRRVQLVMALAHKPRLLILDEPTDGLDPLMRERVLGILSAHARRFQSTMMISPPSIQEPCGRAAAYSPSTRVKSRGVAALRRFTDASWKPPATKCVCESPKDGINKRPPRSITCVSSSRYLSICSVVPTARMAPSRIATASASGAPGVPVQTTPFSSTTSTGLGLTRHPPTRANDAHSIAAPTRRSSGRDARRSVTIRPHRRAFDSRIPPHFSRRFASAEATVSMCSIFAESGNVM